MASTKAQRAKSAFGRLLRGFAYPFRAIGLMFRHPRLWTYALVPILISLVFLSIIFVVLIHHAGSLTGLIWHKPSAWYADIVWYLLYALVFAGTFVLAALTVPLFLIPFNNALTGRVEGILSKDGTIPEASRTALHRIAVDQLGLWLSLYVGYVVLLPFVLIPVAGAVIYPILANLWTMIWSAVNYLDYPMGRHGYRWFRGERVTVRKNFALCLGFGAGVYLILIIPVVDLLFIPVAVVGATLLYADLQGAGALPATAKG